MKYREEDENYEIMRGSRSQSNNSFYLNTVKTKRGNFIVRQELSSYTLECNAKCGMIFNMCLIILFLLVGIPIIILSNNTIEYEIPYTDCSLVGGSNSTCNFTFNLNQTMQAPVLLYYKLVNFHLNHRDLVKSKIYSQLRGVTHVDKSNNSECKGAIYMYEMFDNDESKYQTYWGKPLKGDDYADPCGLVAKSLFNDTFRISNSSGNITLNETGIANSYEREYSFKRNPNYTYLQWMDVENEHFIVWMAMETYKNFQKLWGRVDAGLDPGTYTIEVTDNYNVSQYNAKKSIILSTTSALGVASFYGYLLIAVAAYCALVTFILWVLHVTNKDKKFDYNVLKWK